MNPPKRGTPDFPLFILTLVLSAFGVLMVYSASSMSATYHMHGNSLFYTQKQAIAFILGAIGMLIMMHLTPAKLKRLTLPFCLAVIVMLALVPVFGKEVKGARSWFAVGPLQLQPAEFAKLGIILYLGAMISRKQDKFQSFKKGLLPALIILAIFSGLIMMQPDLGSTVVLCMGAMTVIVVGGANLRQITRLVVFGGAFLALAFGISYAANPDSFGSGYRFARIATFLDPWADERNTGFQIVQSLYAFGHGGLLGAGFGQSIQKLHFLPAPHNDFIFAIIGEELGFVGASLFLLTYLLFIWRGIIVSLRCADPFCSLVGVGIMSTIGFQALINLGGVTNSIPLTGVTLPLISYGGSSMLITLASMGIVLSISREPTRSKSEASAVASSGTGRGNAKRLPRST